MLLYIELQFNAVAISHISSKILGFEVISKL